METTHADMILSVIYELHKQGIYHFTRSQIRDLLHINPEKWNSSFNPVFQSMRADQPGGAPGVKNSYRNIFKRTDRGVYILTEIGRELINGITEKPVNIAIPRFETKATEPDESTSGLILSLATKEHLGQEKLLFEEKVKQLLLNAEVYHQAFYQSEIFGKPCLYFHQRALETRKDPTSIRHLEYIYAMLVAWGMNRPGKNGAKMVSFKTFQESIYRSRECIIEAQSFACCEMNAEKWNVLKDIFKSIRVMVSSTSLVGNSKAMHHILPNIIPPIDRKYTLLFLLGTKNLKNNLDTEWDCMKNIIEAVFIPVSTDKKFIVLADDWMRRRDEFPWDTSAFKIIDNLIIGARK
jgi:hypothetical protein